MGGMEGMRREREGERDTAFQPEMDGWMEGGRGGKEGGRGGREERGRGWVGDGIE
jgi:hypothetical protein